MIDVGLSLFINKRLNKWYRSRALPNGTIDHYYRGVKMSYTAVYRRVTCGVCIFLLLVAGVLYSVEIAPADNTLFTFTVMKMFVVGLILLGIAAPLWAFWEHVIINEEGIIKPRLLGSKTKMEWQDILSYEIRPDDNLVIFSDQSKRKVMLNLAYDGWEDFQKLAAKKMDPDLYWQFRSSLVDLVSSTETN
jgi:hypothetical protein